VTSEKLNEIRLAYLAHHDPLTGLANRALLVERLTDAVETGRAGTHELILSHLLLVGFSEIYETLGNQRG
jgi:GGDEF domain-containing protein